MLETFTTDILLKILKVYIDIFTASQYRYFIILILNAFEIIHQFSLCDCSVKSELSIDRILGLNIIVNLNE